MNVQQGTLKLEPHGLMVVCFHAPVKVEFISRLKYVVKALKEFKKR